MANSSMFSMGDALSDKRAFPVNYWKGFGGAFKPVRQDWRASLTEGNELYDQYKQGVLSNQGVAKDSAATYAKYTQGLFDNPTDAFGGYKQVGDYLYGQLGGYTDILKDAGLRDMNSRLAAQGIRPGSTGYDRLLNATRITSNMLPAFNNTTNAIGRDFNTVANDDYRNMLVRLGLANDDALTGYADRPYERYMDLADTRANQMNQRFGQLGAMTDLFKNNNAGWQIKETNNLAKGVGVFDNLANGVVDLYMSYLGGGMGGMGGGGGGGGYQSQAAQPASFQMGGATQLGNAAGGTGGSNQYAQLLQMIMGMMGKGGGGAPTVTGGGGGLGSYSMPSVPDAGSIYSPSMSY